jgi:hypothetical protein
MCAQIFHRHEVRAADLPELVDLDDVRVMEQRADARLVAEHLDELGRVRLLGPDALDDEDLAALEALDVGAEDLGHASLANAVDEAIAPVLLGGKARRIRDHGLGILDRREQLRGTP